MWVATHIFPAKNISVNAVFNDQSFNDTLTNDIVSFEQLGPDLEAYRIMKIKWKGMDTFSEETTLPKLICIPSKRSLSRRKEFVPYGSKFFVFRIHNPFQTWLIVQESQQGITKVVSPVKWRKIYRMYPVCNSIVLWIQLRDQSVHIKVTSTSSCS